MLVVVAAATMRWRFWFVAVVMGRTCSVEHSLQNFRCLHLYFSPPTCRAMAIDVSPPQFPTSPPPPPPPPPYPLPFFFFFFFFFFSSSIGYFSFLT
ncbi:hypothetical protein BVC80_1833g23 [Macleaya cordata]|uniref:Secreted protein n=1 Tax=Macleaya cordata TaxID=56857 RepID=A0A200R6S4_MACCD|nr:hypothetical protein BVC80_1833g23 [Macleaya cordata]